MNLGPGVVTGASGDPSTALSLALHGFVRDFADAIVTVDPDFERVLLVFAVTGEPGALTWRSSLWLGLNGNVSRVGSAPAWLPYDALVAAHQPKDEWDHLLFRIEQRPADRKITTSVAGGLAGADLDAVVNDPARALDALYAPR